MQSNEVAVAAQHFAFGQTLLGMQIRNEIAVARTAGFVRRLDNQNLANQEIEEMKALFHICRLWSPNDTDQALHNLGNGCFVEFANHAEYKRALRVWILFPTTML